MLLAASLRSNCRNKHNLIVLINTKVHEYIFYKRQRNKKGFIQPKIRLFTKRVREKDVPQIVPWIVPIVHRIVRIVPQIVPQIGREIPWMMPLDFNYIII